MVTLPAVPTIFGRAARISLCLTDCDGVLTDAGVYYTADGDELKRFSIRDGMGVQLLREVGVEVGIVSGEKSLPLLARAQKLAIEERHLGIVDKLGTLHEICERRNIAPEDVAYIGDDVNDLQVMRAVGLAAAPADAVFEIRTTAHVVVDAVGGHGAFRALADLIVSAKRREETV
jgi:3-deoxy-D-manno-octulosonate 8-phosphate phosphatase (KDO 8-P phosphatase)